MTKRSRPAKKLAKTAIRWHRPKAKNSDITVVSANMGHTANIPSIKGGGRISITRFGTEYELRQHHTERTLDLSLGELEAIALIYAKLQEAE